MAAADLRANEASAVVPVDSASSAAVTIIANGEPRTVAARTLGEALEALGYGDTIVATAVNGEFGPARRRVATPIADGDRIEIVAPRQGG